MAHSLFVSISLLSLIRALPSHAQNAHYPKVMNKSKASQETAAVRANKNPPVPTSTAGGQPARPLGNASCCRMSHRPDTGLARYRKGHEAHPPCSFLASCSAKPSSRRKTVSTRITWMCTSLNFLQLFKHSPSVAKYCSPGFVKVFPVTSEIYHSGLHVGADGGKHILDQKNCFRLMLSKKSLWNIY